MIFVLDASALLALLHRESGAERVESVLQGACVGSVNWSEVVQKSMARGVEVAGMRDELVSAGLGFPPFTVHQAELAGRLWADTKPFGLSLADRACLALALDRSLPVLTTDRVWQELKLDVRIEVVR